MGDLSQGRKSFPENVWPQVLGRIRTDPAQDAPKTQPNMATGKRQAILSRESGSHYHIVKATQADRNRLWLAPFGMLFLDSMSE